MQAELAKRVVGAFPLSMCARVEAAIGALANAEHDPTPDDVGPIVLQGEEVRIPFRVYFPSPAPTQFSGLSEVERQIVECIYTRHHDGRVRERYLERLLPLDKGWVAPFIVQLLGEYVLEILQVLDRARDLLMKPCIREFVAENPAFMWLTRQRVVSYWNCYHRARFPKREDYPGFRVLEVLEA